jgi:hypothetical protein
LGARVDFQDYVRLLLACPVAAADLFEHPQNKDVLAHVTIPNVVLNWAHEARAVDSTFFAGDWAHIAV